ncbi:MAG: toxin co-regulated pilus biosynthesis Q family protein [Alphaproteobacteria bacterium]|nr:toxin co-regulated pilus biosynthesis Q family protein [Alphaproteobacteria bacterium]MBO4643554.1 toxin co-regulated pilus biosynthesis Q family protein [Alphaproteobacteria bacterium]
MAYPYKKISIISLFTAVFVLNGCTQFIEDDQAWPGVSAGTTSAAPEFTAPVGGGQFGQRTPPDVLQNTYGYRGEDLSATAPSSGGRGLYSYDSSKETNLNANTLNNAQSQAPAPTVDSSSATATETAASSEETYDPADPVEDWLATEGSSVRSLLTEWGDKAGWRVIWNTDREYILEAGAMFRGRFMDVSSALIRSFARARPAPWGTFYKGNRVLLVTTQEDENAD